MSTQVKPEAKKTQRLLNYRDASQYLGISERSMWDLGKNQEIQMIRIGSSVRFDLRDLDEWIESKKA